MHEYIFYTIAAIGYIIIYLDMRKGDKEHKRKHPEIFKNKKKIEKWFLFPLLLLGNNLVGSGLSVNSNGLLSWI